MVSFTLVLVPSFSESPQTGFFVSHAPLPMQAHGTAAEQKEGFQDKSTLGTV